MSLSVVIPAFRATRSLRLLTEMLLNATGMEVKEVILVFDAGKHQTWQEAQALAMRYPQVTAVRLGRNFGQHNATICGIQYCTSDLVVTMDEDLQHHPEDIPKLVKCMQDNAYDVVYGKYKVRKHRWWRNTTSMLLKRLLRTGMPGLHPDYTSFRLIRRQVAIELLGMRNTYTFLDGYLTWLTSSVGSCEVDHGEGAEASSYSFVQLLRHTVNILFNFTSIPVRVLTALTVATLTVSMGYTGFTVVSAIFDKDFLIGFPSIVALLGLGFGMMLLGLTVIVQYISRINEKVTERPTFIVREVIGRV